MRNNLISSLVFCLAFSSTAAAVRADEKAAGKPRHEKQTIPRPIWLLVDAKTQDKIHAGNKGDTLTYYSRDERGRYEGRFHLDPASQVFDWSPAFAGVGGVSGATVPFRGIYELNDDELKIYFNEPRSDRPKTFDFKEGWLLVLKRSAQDIAPEDK